MSTGFPVAVSVVDAHQLASVIRNRIENVLLIDSRSFLEHNSCHIATAVNVCCSKIVKRRLQQDKLSAKELLMHACHCDVDEKLNVVVYDQSSEDIESLPTESFTIILLKKLQPTFQTVNLLAGGFDGFHQFYPDLCEDKTRKCPPLTSLSQPCLPIANQGPTRILPFLYLGSQYDALNKDLLINHNITYELNVSTTCPQPEFVAEGHFMRIPVNDTYSEKLLPYFPEAFNFLDKVREGSGCVLVHCLAGISRSPTIAIAYVMRYLHLSSDDGYRYVKSKRPTISPNFNFLGQLLEYEKQLRRENVLDSKPEVTSAPPLCSKKRVCRTDMRTSKLSLDITPQKNEFPTIFLQPRSGDQSPTTALAKLSFDGHKGSGSNEEDNRVTLPDFRQYRSKSCYGDWLRDRDELVADKKTKECNFTPASKVLSPVKEIKCDGLISEISSGSGDGGGKSMSCLSVRQRMRSSYHAGEGKHVDAFAHFASETSRLFRSSGMEEKFSIQTLTHQMFTSNAKGQEFPNYDSQQKTIHASNAFNTIENKVRENRKSYDDYQKDGHHVRVGPCMADRSCTPASRREKTDMNFVFRESAFQTKPSSLHPWQVHSYKRSDSAGTSGFGSESSDSAENASEVSRRPEQFRLDIDLEELEDGVIVRNQDHFSPHHGASDQSFFPFPLPNIASSDWPSLRSPLSPSESHLLEDLDMEKDPCKSGSNFNNNNKPRIRSK